MTKYVIITLAVLTTINGAALDPINPSVSDPSLLDPGVFDPSLWDPSLTFDPNGLSNLPGSSPEPPLLLNELDPWLSWDNHSQIFPDYVEPIPTYEKCAKEQKVKRPEATKYDHSWVSDRTGKPAFSNTWLKSLEEFEKNVNPTMEHAYEHYLGSVLRISANGTLRPSGRNALNKIVHHIYGRKSPNLPAYHESDIEQATLEQLIDIMRTWHIVHHRSPFKDCNPFRKQKCGSKFNFCDKPKRIENKKKAYEDICAEHRVPVEWVKVKVVPTGQIKDCWVPPEMNLYYVACHTPGKKGSNFCKFDYGTDEETACVPSAKVRRTVWVLCPIGSQAFTIEEFEQITPTGCSCMKCKCCQLRR